VNESKEPTAKRVEELREWAIDRLGLIYLGLTQLPETYGQWERYYEEEIEPITDLVALVEEKAAQIKAEATAYLRPEVAAERKGKEKT